jgi:hypothetical protein
MLRFLVFKNYAATVEEESTGASLSKIDRESLLQKAMDYYIKVRTKIKSRNSPLTLVV